MLEARVIFERAAWWRLVTTVLMYRPDSSPITITGTWDLSEIVLTDPVKMATGAEEAAEGAK